MKWKTKKINKQDLYPIRRDYCYYGYELNISLEEIPFIIYLVHCSVSLFRIATTHQELAFL
jgi:hypothetical protein